MGRIADRLVAVDGQPAVRPMICPHLSCDHRIIDGALRDSLLKAVVETLQAPGALLR